MDIEVFEWNDVKSVFWDSVSVNVFNLLLFVLSNFVVFREWGCIW